MEEYMHDHHLMQRYEYQRDRFMDEVRQQQLLSPAHQRRFKAVHITAARLWRYISTLRPAQTTPSPAAPAIEKHVRKSAV